MAMPTCTLFSHSVNTAVRVCLLVLELTYYANCEPELFFLFSYLVLLTVKHNSKHIYIHIRTVVHLLEEIPFKVLWYFTVYFCYAIRHNKCDPFSNIKLFDNVAGIVLLAIAFSPPFVC